MSETRHETKQDEGWTKNPLPSVAGSTASTTDEGEGTMSKTDCTNCGGNQFTAAGKCVLDVGFCLRCGTMRSSPFANCEYGGFLKHLWLRRVVITDVGGMPCKCHWAKRLWYLVTGR